MDLDTAQAMGFDFNLWSLAAAFIFGIVGLVVLRFGRKRANLHWTALGVLLMIYPYFVSGAVWNWLVGFALCGATYYYKDR